MVPTTASLKRCPDTNHGLSAELLHHTRRFATRGGRGVRPYISRSLAWLAGEAPTPNRQPTATQTSVLALCYFQLVVYREGAEDLAGAYSSDLLVHRVVDYAVQRDMGGREMVKKLAASRPGAKVLYLSGYTEDAIISDGSIEKGTAFLQKPFTLQNLTRKVREVLT